MAPWQGRFYERLVGLVKQSLRKGIDRKLLYWDNALTMLVEVEAIINTRPLTYLYSEFSICYIRAIRLILGHTHTHAHTDLRKLQLVN